MLQRHRLRWLNGAGFALTLFFAAWLLVFLLSLLAAQFEDVVLPMGLPFAIVGGLALVANIALLSIVIFGHVMQGADLGHWRARLLLFGWTCTGALFCLSQTVVLLRHGAGSFPHLSGWFSDLYWYFCIVGALVFLLLLWVNSEHHEMGDVDDEYAEYDDYEEYEEYEDPTV